MKSEMHHEGALSQLYSEESSCACTRQEETLGVMSEPKRIRTQYPSNVNPMTFPISPRGTREIKTLVPIGVLIIAPDRVDVFSLRLGWRVRVS